MEPEQITPRFVYEFLKDHGYEEYQIWNIDT